MTQIHMNRPAVTVPVGLGGKTAPYVADPAPTLIIEFPSVETNQELARIASLESAAREEAHRITEQARADTAQMQQEAADAVEQLLAAAQSERQAALAEIGSDREALSADREVFARQIEDLESRERELERNRSALDDRLARADEDVAEAARILASARTDVETTLQEAQAAADSMIQDAISQAQAATAEMLDQARDSMDTEELVAQRLAEVESMHRVEVQVLTDREVELLNRIAHLEAKLAAASEPADTSTTSDPVDDHVAIALEQDDVSVRVPDPRLRNGRHASEAAEMGARAMASHAPLTEQLSTSAFRTITEQDRKGKRRR